MREVKKGEVKAIIKIGAKSSTIKLIKYLKPLILILIILNLNLIFFVIYLKLDILNINLI